MWCADVAMYRAKLGNLAFAISSRSSTTTAINCASSRSCAAISDGQLVLHYQPQLDLRTGQILAVEALVRWAHPRLGLVPPAKFLPLAEEADLMWPITTLGARRSHLAVLGLACYRTQLVVSVNVSPSNLLEAGFTDLVRQQLDDTASPRTDWCSS